MSFNINPEDIFATYKNGVEDVAIYNRLKNLLKQGFNTNEIINMCPDLSKWGIYNRLKTIKNGGKPASLKCVDHLNDLGVLPLNIKNTRLNILNLLISFAFWQGARSPNANSTGSYNAIVPRNKKDYDILKKILNELNCTWGESNFIHESKDDETKRIILDQRLFRLIHLMGYVTGAKSKSTVLIPTYIQDAYDIFTDLEANRADKKIAYDILFDFMLTLFYFKINYRINHKYLALTKFSSAKKSEMQANILKKIGEIIMPNIRFTASSPYIPKDKRNYYSRLSLNGKQIESEIVEKVYLNRVEEVINQTRMLTLQNLS